MKADAEDLVATYRGDGGRLLATLIRQFGDFDLAEEALAEAWLRAAREWGGCGRPDNPGAWVLTVARRLALDTLRKRARHSRPDLQQAILDAEMDRRPVESDEDIPDDRLRLIFTCCHPALAREARVALTLRTLGGLSVEQIARAFLVKPGALARRLTRAKTKIRETGIRYRVPDPEELPHRLPQVLEVVYLIYNEGYAASDGVTQVRDDLATEAIRLARLVHDLLPLPETAGLLALTLLHDARRGARVGPDGAVVPLERQDRSLWDRNRFGEGRRLLLRALAEGKPGPYQIQAAISAVHLEAASWQDTDWAQIAGLYGALEAVAPSDVVRLNRAVALAHAGNLSIAEGLLDGLGDALADYQPFYAARAEIRRQAGDLDGARADLSRAEALSGNSAERRFLRDKLDRL